MIHPGGPVVLETTSEDTASIRKLRTLLVAIEFIMLGGAAPKGH